MSPAVDEPPRAPALVPPNGNGADEAALPLPAAGIEQAASAAAEQKWWRRFLQLEWVPSAGRASALYVLIGASLALWIQTAFQARWVKDFVLANQLEPPKRKLLVVTIGAGAALAAALGLGAMAWLGAKRRPIERVEKIAWFLSPLMVIGTLPLLFRHGIWKGRVFDLLLATAAVTFLTEGLVRRSLMATPERLKSWIEWLRARAPAFLRTHAATITVGLAVVGYSVFMTAWTIVRHRKLQSAVFDLGISDNLMANAMAGEFMKTPVFSGTAGGINFLAGHFQIGQYVFLPFYALYPNAETLLAIQSVALGASAIPLYAFCRHRLSAWTSALIALGFLAYHPMHGANFYEMTYLPVACPFIIGTIWALDAKRYIVMIPIFLAALSMREDISFGLAIAATAFVLANHRRGPALIVAVVSALYFAIIRFIVMPGLGTWCFPDLMYRELIPPGAPSTFGSVIKTLVTNPAFTFTKLATQPKLIFLLHLLVPVAFLPIRRAWLWVALLPGIIITLLTTSYTPTVSMGFHYTMHWTPYIWMAVPLGLAAIAKSSADGPWRMRATLAAILLASSIASFNLGAFGKHSDFLAGFSPFEFKYDAKQRAQYEDLRALIEMIPKEASLAVMERVGAHSSNRVKAYSMRNGTQGAEYVLAGRHDGVENERLFLQNVVSNTDYGVFARRGDFALLKRGHDPSGNKQLKADWGL